LHPKIIVDKRRRNIPILNLKTLNMIDITCELNGKKIDIRDKSAIERAIIEEMAQIGIEHVKSKLSQSEFSQVTITIKGDSIDNLSLSINGPDEIMEKLQTGLA
jgi:TATA-binding protein-associated factor Taf7